MKTLGICFAHEYVLLTVSVRCTCTAVSHSSHDCASKSSMRLGRGFEATGRGSATGRGRSAGELDRTVVPLCGACGPHCGIKRARMSVTVLCCPVLNSHTHVNSEAVNRNTDSIHAFWTENTECIHSSTVTQLFSKGVSVTGAGSS